MKEMSLKYFFSYQTPKTTDSQIPARLKIQVLMKTVVQES